MAFFQFGQLAHLEAVAPLLAQAVCVRTFVTRTLNSSWTAALICVLVAQRLTSNGVGVVARVSTGACPFR